MGRASSLAAAKATSARARAEHLLADACRGPLARRRDDRELLGVDAPQVGLVAAGLDAQGRAASDLEVDSLAGGQARDDVGDQSGRHGQGAFGLDLARRPTR